MQDERPIAADAAGLAGAGPDLIAGLEAGLIAAIAVNPTWYWPVREHLPPDAAEAFVTYRSRWEKLCSAVEAGEPTGGIAFGLAAVSDPVDAARRLSRGHRVRLLTGLASAALDGLSHGRSVQEVASEIAAGLARLQLLLGNHRVGQLAWGDTLLAEVAQDVQLAQRFAHAASDTRGLPSGLPTLDWLLNGWLPGGLYVLGGAPGVGKTSLAIQLACHAVQTANRLVVVYFT